MSRHKLHAVEHQSCAGTCSLSLDRASIAMDSTSSTASDAGMSPGPGKKRARVSNKKVTQMAE
eukprot:9477100-Lingulodinium_polyedra.AAC.1